MPFNTSLTLIASNAPVTHNNVNAPLQQLYDNTKYLLDLLQAAMLGSTLYARQQAIEAGALVGMPVWYNPDTHQFERALAATITDNDAGALLTAGSTQVWGIVANKSTTTLADILLSGFAAVDISAAVTGAVTAGTYYLSSVTAGMLVTSKPPVSVAVLRATSDGKVFVMPQFIDFLDRHTHYHFPLVCAPSGSTSPPAPEGRHVITDADATLPGWLPASDSHFNGKAPPGAAFGYNLAAHPDLAAAWPPIPASNAHLEWNKGLDPAIGGTVVPSGPLGAVIFDVNGIWWMSDCYDDVPWPLLTDTSIDSASWSESVDAGTTRHLEMTLELYFSAVDFTTDTPAVTTLHSQSPRIKVYQHGTTTPGSVGNLDLLLDLNLVSTTNQLGYTALKSFDPTTYAFTSGPVTEGLYALSDNVQLTGSTTRKLDPADPSSATVYQGLVGVSVTPAESLELVVASLYGETWATYQNTPYISFPAATTTSYRGQVNVPLTLSVPTPTLVFHFVLLGRTLGTTPALTLTARIVAFPTDATDLPVNADEFNVTLDTVTTLTGDNQYFAVASTAFAVSPGDTVYFTLGRTSDVYAGEVGILRQYALIVSA